jgi:hypothetical protein
MCENIYGFKFLKEAYANTWRKTCKEINFFLFIDKYIDIEITKIK